MGFVPYIQATLTLTLVVVTILVFAAIRTMTGAVRDLLSMFRKGHGYSDPSAAAVVTDSPTPEPSPEPAPAPARAALPSEAPTPPASPAPVPAPIVRAAPPVHAPPRRVAPPSPVRPWDRPFKPSAERVAEAQRAHTEATGAEGDRPAIQPAAPDDVTDEGRATDEGETQIWTAEPETVDVGTDLSPETLARVDALAQEQGVTRSDVLARLAHRGIAEEEKRASLSKGKGNGKP